MSDKGKIELVKIATRWDYQQTSFYKIVGDYMKSLQEEEVFVDPIDRGNLGYAYIIYRDDIHCGCITTHEHIRGDGQIDVRIWASFVEKPYRRAGIFSHAYSLIKLWNVTNFNLGRHPRIFEPNQAMKCFIEKYCKYHNIPDLAQY